MGIKTHGRNHSMWIHETLMLAFGILTGVQNSEALWEDMEPLPPGRYLSDRRFIRELPDGRLQQLNSLTRFLIELLPLTKIEEITEENTEEVCVRLLMLQIAIGPPEGCKAGDLDAKSSGTPLADVKRHVGLRAFIPFAKENSFETIVSDALRMQAADMLHPDSSEAAALGENPG